MPFSDPVAEKIDQAHTRASIWLADALFHPPPEELPEHTGSGDTLWNWTQTGALLALSLVAAAVWTALDRRRFERADAEHLRITGEAAFEVKLKAIPDSAFMLLRDFHWVQPMPVNR